jgi:RNA polymerase sigma factor (sigma-70 family)
MEIVDTFVAVERNTPGTLAEQFRAGDREAFTEIYRANHPAVFRFALNMTGDRIKAGELTQDVFVWLIHHPGGFDPQRGELGAFLIGVTRKLLLRQ